MADINVKYQKLADDAQKLIVIDDEIIDATKRGDQSLMQAMLVSRSGLIRQIRDLAAFKP